MSKQDSHIPGKASSDLFLLATFRGHETTSPMLTLGLIREGKTPADSRVVLSPIQAASIQDHYPVRVLVQPSGHRCFSNAEYRQQGLTLTEDMRGCDVLLGVKEVPVSELMDGATYLFFSHTIKKQPYNRGLLQSVLERQIRLIDYEVLTDDQGRRVIAFGYFAGMVGAHNALLTWGRRTGDFELKRMKNCFDYAEAKALYRTLSLPPIRVVLTGGGRVASGAEVVLRDMGLAQVSPEDYLAHTYPHAVFTRLNCADYAARSDGQPFDRAHFYAYPEAYASIFHPYTSCSDIMINGIFWDHRAPAFFTPGEMAAEDFRIRVIADVTCDIAPESSIPSTLRASTIADPIFGYDPIARVEVPPHSEGVIDMMTIDNLPSELPRDASESFGQQFTEHVLWPLLSPGHPMISRATIADAGHLGPNFEYLREYVYPTSSINPPSS